MSEDVLEAWEHRFRIVTEADHYYSMSHHLKRLDLPTRGDWLLEGTIDFIRACFSYATIDGRDGYEFAEFLEHQEPSEVERSKGRYWFLFEIWDVGFARISIDIERHEIDLADLFEYPWHRVKARGYTKIFVSRDDWANLNEQEASLIQSFITDDIRFDNSEEDLALWFDHGDQWSEGDCYLVANLQIPEGEDDSTC